jgi:deazaflavin-dependent oxidoreductase (nitroreductase family)
MENNMPKPSPVSPFWFMNKIANPLVRLILKSPLHGWLSRSILLITYYGRKSGRKYTLPVQYAPSADTLYIIPGASGQKTWWRNLRGGASIQVLMEGQLKQAQAQVLTGAADCDEIARALKVFVERFPAATRLHSIQVKPDGSLDESDLYRAAASVVVVRVRPQETGHPGADIQV